MPVLRLATSCGREATVSCQAGQKLSEAIWLSDAVESQPLCAGLGLCGRCRVRFMDQAPEPCKQDLERLTGSEIAAGWRLACHHAVPDKPETRLLLPGNALRQEAGALPAAKLTPCCIGIDLGTTSIQWQAITRENPDARNGAMPNPQSGAGSDIISRLEFALKPGGLKLLSELAKRSIARILEVLAANGLSAKRICIAANTAMTEILLCSDPKGLASAPYSLAFKGGTVLELELPGTAKVVPCVIPPLPAPFIGGDTSAGLLALANEQRPFILADLGTNAEFALLDKDGRLFFASAPLGPALEGIGPACGQAAGPGTITGFQLSPYGLAPVWFQGQAAKEAAGISASGYISLLALLLNTGLLSPEGQFRAAQTPLAGKIPKPDSGRLDLPYGQYLNSADIEMLLKVKAAFALTLRRLFEAAGLASADLQSFFLAGALGEYTEPADLATLGFIPSLLAKKLRIAGNTSLRGACMLAQEPARNDWLINLCANATVIQAADDPDFMTDYLSAMQWGSHAA